MSTNTQSKQKLKTESPERERKWIVLNSSARMKRKGITSAERIVVAVFLWAWFAFPLKPSRQKPKQHVIHDPAKHHPSILRLKCHNLFQLKISYVEQTAQNHSERSPTS